MPQGNACINWCICKHEEFHIDQAFSGKFESMSKNVKVYGSVYSAESCSYDATRGVIVAPNRGVAQNVQTNNAWITFLNHDGSVHTSRWVGIQNPADRANLKPPLVLNEPLGSDIAGGVLYLAAALGLGARFIHLAWRLHRDCSDALARRTFRYSIAYLSWLFAALLVDHYLPL